MIDNNTFLFSADRVMTVSFHKHDGDFFPGTGGLREIGKGLCHSGMQKPPIITVIMYTFLTYEAWHWLSAWEQSAYNVLDGDPSPVLHW